MDTKDNQQGVVRCIGKPNEEVKVYLEEKSDLFLKENMTDRVGHFQMYYLLGREYRLGKQTIYLIRGILEGESGNSRQIHFTGDQLRSLQRRQERQYPKYQVLGWALNQPGYGNDGAWRFAKENEEFFAGAPLLMMGDGLDGSLAFYQWFDGDYHELGGYYVYSDQNPADFRGAQSQQAQQAASLDKRMEERKMESTGPLPWELPQEEPRQAIWDRLPGREKRAESIWQEREPRKTAASARLSRREKSRSESSPFRVLTSLSAILLMVTLVMGMLLFNSVSALDGIQTRLETMDMQIDEMYETMTVAAPADPETVQTQAPAEGETSEVAE